jgi:type II secretory pathway predicted ATPase ExeA
MKTVNQWALIRQALLEHLKRLHLSELEERDRRGYEAQPQRIEEFRVPVQLEMEKAFSQ